MVAGDNIDKNYRPSYQRQDRQIKSLHHFHAYAVKNRVDVSSLSDARPAAVISPESFLPTQSDLDKLSNDFEISVSRYVIFKKNASDNIVSCDICECMCLCE